MPRITDGIGSGDQLAIDAVEAGRVRLVDEIDLDLGDICRSAAGGFHDLLQVQENLPGLFLDIAGDEVSGLRVLGDMGRAHCAAGLNRAAQRSLLGEDAGFDFLEHESCSPVQPALPSTAWARISLRRLRREALSPPSHAPDKAP